MRLKPFAPFQTVSGTAYQRNRKNPFLSQRLNCATNLLTIREQPENRGATATHQCRCGTQFLQPPFERVQLGMTLKNNPFKVIVAGVRIRPPATPGSARSPAGASEAPPPNPAPIGILLSSSSSTAPVECIAPRHSLAARPSRLSGISTFPLTRMPVFGEGV